MYYYKYNNKLVPINIHGVCIDAPHRRDKFKLIIENNDIINEDINLCNITSFKNMYSKNKINILLPISENENLKKGDLVVFIDNNTVEQLNITYGWCDDMENFLNGIGQIVEERYDMFSGYRVLFNEEICWTIVPSCLMKISKDIKVL